MRGPRRSRSIIAKPPAKPGPDLNSPGSRDYAERHRVTETPIFGGMVRIDIGEPIP